MGRNKEKVEGMKRKIAGILLAGLLAFSGTGCAQNGEAAENSSSVSNSQSVSESTSNSQSVSESISNSQSVESTSGVSGESATTPTPTATETKERIQVSIPQKEGMQADYTSVEGIQLAPGSYLAVVAKDMDTDYWKAVKVGAQQAIDELNAALNYTGEDKITMTFEGTADSSDAEEQSNTIDLVISENPGALCLGIIDMQTCKTQLEMAAENGIPVIIVDSGVDSDLINSFCGIDNRAAGAEAARKLCEAIGDAGEIAIVAHESTTQTSIERVEGFSEEIVQNHPNVTIVQTGYSDGEQEISAMVEGMMQQYPQLKGVFCTNQQVSNETLAVLETKETAIKMVGFDYSEEQAEAIASGLQYGTVSQNPYSLGYAMIVAAARAAAGMTNDAFVDAGYQWMDQTNISSEELAIYRY